MTTPLHLIQTTVRSVDQVRPTIATHKDADGFTVPTLGDPIWHVTIRDPLWITLTIPGSDPGIKPGDLVTLSITKVQRTEP